MYLNKITYEHFAKRIGKPAFKAVGIPCYDNGPHRFDPR